MGQTKIEKELANAKKQIGMLQIQIVKVLDQQRVIDSYNQLNEQYAILEKKYKKLKRKK